MVKGQTFTVVFPAAGNYKFECLVHAYMTGEVHVLGTGAILPHDQNFYDQEAAQERQALLTDTDASQSMPMDMGDSDGPSMDGSVTVRILSRRDHSEKVENSGAGGPLAASEADENSVKAGVGEVSMTPGGYQSRAVLRFLDKTITIHTGDTVEWTNRDPQEPHTITFGPEADDPANPFPPSADVTVDPDGALHAILSSPSEEVHSGALLQALVDEPGLPDNSNTPAFNPTRFRATFTQPGTYNYHCVFHDTLGMVGKVIVVP